MRKKKDTNLSGFTEVNFLGTKSYLKNLPPSNENTENKVLNGDKYAKSIDEYLENKKNEVPIYDPHTGEINSEYEKLTGTKNPLITNQENIKILEPKMSNRFLVHFPKSFKIPPYNVSSINKPSVSITPKKIFGFVYGYKKTFSDIDVVIRDFIGFNTSEILLNKIYDSFSLTIEELDPTGAVVETTIIENCRIKHINHGKMSYDKNEMNLITLTISYNNIIIKK